jgi:hypothetical protein
LERDLSRRLVDLRQPSLDPCSAEQFDHIVRTTGCREDAGQDEERAGKSQGHASLEGRVDGRLVDASQRATALLAHVRFPKKAFVVGIGWRAHALVI